MRPGFLLERISFLWNRNALRVPLFGAPSVLRLRWVETAGPPVARPEKRGFGSRPIEYGLSRDLGAEVRLDFAQGSGGLHHHGAG